jgi:hypothetical protein
MEWVSVNVTLKLGNEYVQHASHECVNFPARSHHSVWDTFPEYQGKRQTHLPLHSVATEKDYDS